MPKVLIFLRIKDLFLLHLLSMVIPAILIFKSFVLICVRLTTTD